MATGRWLTWAAGVVVVGLLAVIAAYGPFRSHSDGATATSPITVSPTQTAQQTVQVVLPPGTAAAAGAAQQADSAAAAARPGSVARAAPVAVGDITFEVRACRHAVRGIQCDFQVTNAGGETHVRVFAYSDLPDSTVAFDSAGVTRAVRDANFAGVRRDGLGVEARLSPSVPTPLVVVFEETFAPVFAAITLGVRIPQIGGTSASRAVVFRNVRIDG
jgi:hypothetical protein